MCIRQSLFTRAGLLAALSSWMLLPSVHAASADLIGYRLVRDADFYGAASPGRNNVYLSSIDSGGRLAVYFRNTSGSPVTPTGLRINGTPFAGLPAEPFAGYVSNTTWWTAWTNRVVNQGCGAVWMRLKDLDQTLGSTGITFRVDLSGGGTFDFSFKPEPSPLWIPFVHCASNLQRLTVYAANRGTNTVDLKPWGGVTVNGVSVTGHVAQTALPPETTAPIVLDLPTPLTEGGMTIVHITADDDTTTGAGHLRAFPSRFGVTFWLTGSEWDTEDAVRRQIEPNFPNAVAFQDEPQGGRYDPMTNLIPRVTNSWARYPTKPLLMQNTGYEEIMVYGGLTDIGMMHRGPVEQDLSLYYNAPQPIWYLPQDVWARNESLNAPDRWYPLEDLRFQALRAVGQGAKNIQWFSYMNIWEQGYDRGGGADYARIFQDTYMGGAIGNPLLWNRVGRVSGVLQVLNPFLIDSAPLGRETTTNGLEIDTLVLGTNRMLAVLVDVRTPAGSVPQAYGVDEAAQQVRYNTTVTIQKPVAYTPGYAWLVDPFFGVTNLPFSTPSSNRVSVTLPELDTAATILLGDADDGATLRARWSAIATNFSEGDGYLTTLRARAPAVRENPWAISNLNGRARVAVTNTGASTAGVIGLPIDLPENRTFSSNAFRVTEATSGATNFVDFFVEPEKAYENFATVSCVNRFQYDPASGSGYVNVVYTNNALYFYCRVSSMDRRNFYLYPQTPSPWNNGSWIPSDYRTLQVEGLFEPFQGMRNIQLVFDFDRDGNGSVDKSHSVYYFWDLPQTALSNGWKRYRFDAAGAWDEVYPGEAMQGQWRFRFITAMYPGDKYTNQAWALRNIRVGGAGLVRARPSGGGLPAGHARTYDLYYDVTENGPFTAPAPEFDASLAGATCSSDAQATLLATETAGLTAWSGPGSNTLVIATDTDVPSLFVRHLDGNGALRGEQTVAPASPGRFVAAVSAVDPADRFACAPIQPGGEGVTFLVDAYGQPVEDETISTLAAWTHDLEGKAYDAALNADGTRVALADGNTMTVFDNQGIEQWSTSYVGRTAFVRFSPDGQWLYVAANISSNLFTGSDWRIHKYPATGGTPVWRHQTGSGFAAYPGRTPFDMQAFPDGGVGYCDWNNTGARLNTAGNPTYARNAGSGYTLRMAVANNNQSLILGGSARPIAASGAYNGSGIVNSNGEATACAISPDGARWAFAGNRVTLVSGASTVIAQPHCGRYVRALRFSPDGAYLAAGSSDGRFTLLDAATGTVLWQTEEPNAYVTDIRFLPEDQGVVYALEIYAYTQTDQWRYHDRVEARSLVGALLWENEGPWRDTAFMTRIEGNDDGDTWIALTADSLRLFQPQFSIQPPNIVPDGGVFIDEVSITITSATAGMTIRYTLDDSTPTNTSTLYGAPFLLTNSATVRAVAYTNDQYSSVVAAPFVRKLATPVIDPPGAAFLDPVLVTITTHPAYASIRYTTNGTMPDASSALYAAPFYVSTDLTLRARAFLAGVTESDPVEALFRILTNGVATVPVTNVTIAGISGAVAQASIVVSNSGVAPLDFSLWGGGTNYTWRDSKTALGPRFDWIDITNTGTYVENGTNLLYSRTGWSEEIPLGMAFPFYTQSFTYCYANSRGGIGFTWGGVQSWPVNPAFPTDKAPAGYLGVFYDFLCPSNSEAAVYYEAREDDTVISFMNILRENAFYGTGANGYETFQTILQKSGCITYQYAELSGTLNQATVGFQDTQAGPDVNVTTPGTTYLQSDLRIDFAPPAPWLSYAPTGFSLAAGATTSIVFSADGAGLTNGRYRGFVYLGHNDPDRQPIGLPIEFTVGHVLSPPVISPTEGVFNDAIMIELLSTNEDVRIRYTTDGSDPHAYSKEYVVPFFENNDAVIKARCYKTNYCESTVSEVVYTFDYSAGAPVISPPSGAYTNPILIAITSSLAGATIRYTLDGSQPIGGSPVYGAPFTLSTSAVLRANAFTGVYSPATTAAYTIAFLPVIAVTASEGGTVTPSGELTFPLGFSTTFVIAADAFYELTNVLVNGASVGAPTNYLWNNITSNGTLHAAFAPEVAGQHNTPYAWLANFNLTNGGLTFEQAELDDPDLDSFPSWQEYLANTVPTDGLDYLRFPAVPQRAGNGVRVLWASKSNRWYSLYYADNLDGAFTLLGSGLEATPPTNAYLHTNATNTPGIYKIVVDPLP